jgi:hypothetical protein
MECGQPLQIDQCRLSLYYVVYLSIPILLDGSDIKEFGTGNNRSVRPAYSCLRSNCAAHKNL